MAFVNEKLSQEEEVAFMERKIPAPVCPLNILRTPEWTINHEKDVFLVWGSHPREFMWETYFVLGWKGTYIPMLLKEVWLNNMTCQWSIIEFDIPKDLSEERQKIINDLKEALTVFGFDGRPENANNNLYEIVFEF